ncbi:MAG: hypothetical protein LUG93_12185 [Lachnospiraceae bacterium]|nr:hypothetical protein [Lachnospiraceae bacterium]
MTSKISFFKLVRGEMRQLNWLLAVQITAFVLVLPFRALMSMAIRQNQVTRNGTADYSALEQFARHVGLGHAENTALILALGAIGALAAFSYIFSQVKQDFYHSLSLKREELFAAKCLSSFLTFAPAYLISQILVLFVGLFYGALTRAVALEIVLASLQGLLFYLCSYSATLLAMMLAGNLLTAFLAIGAFGGYLPVCRIFAESLASEFLSTQMADGYDFSNSWMRFTSPWAWCLYSTGHGARGTTGRLATPGDLCQVVAITVVLTLIALALYRIRKTEVAGSALAFGVLEPVIKVMVTVPVSLVAGLIAFELTEAVFFEVVFILLFGALASMIIEFIYRVDIRQVFSHIWQFAIAAVIACAVFFTFRFDLMGFNTYLPSEDELAAMSVSSSLYSTYICYDENGDIAYATSEKDYLDQVEWEDFAGIYELAENGVEKVRQYGHSSEIYNGNVSSVYIKYYLKNGKEVYRYYLVDTDLYCEVMNELIDEEEFRNQYFSICSWDEEIMSEITSVWASVYGISEIEMIEGAVVAETAADVEEETDTGAAADVEAETDIVAETDIGAAADGQTDTDAAEAGDGETDVEVEGSADAGADINAAADTDSGEEGADLTDTEALDADDIDEGSFYIESYLSVDISVPLSRLSDLVEAYREDLKTVSFEDIYNNEGSEIYFYMDHSYRSETYPVNMNFTNTMALLQEIYEEQQG